jgi:hypothetical protein
MVSSAVSASGSAAPGSAGVEPDVARGAARATSLATDLRPPRAVGPDPLVRLAADGGAQGLHLGGGCTLGEVSLVARAAARAGLEIASLSLPLPERPVTAGRRLPRLGASDPEERRAAIALAEQGLAPVAGRARLVLLDFGPVSLAASAAAVGRAFSRRALDEDEPGGALLAGALAERRARGAAVVDACRWALEALLRSAEPLGATLVLPVGASPWEAPSPREARELVALFAGAPLGVAWDPGRLSALCALGLGISDDSLRALAGSAALAVENDAVGLRVGYLPGLGERDPRVAALAAPDSTLTIILGSPDTTDDEVASVLASRSGSG